MEQRAAMETNSARNPPAVVSDSAQMGTPAPRPHQSDNVLDGQKIGGTLLFCGVTLALVGLTYISMGWQYYRANARFEWTQLLGPILISVGGTFVLTSVCKFSIISCWPCRQWDEEALGVAAMEQTSRGRRSTISGGNQPISLHGVTTTLCSPPAYSFTTQEVHQVGFQPGSSLSGVHAAIPPHDAADDVDNVAFTSEEDSSAHSTEAEHRGSRMKKTQNKRGCGGKSGCTWSPPPAYEDIYPSLNQHNLS